MTEFSEGELQQFLAAETESLEQQAANIAENTLTFNSISTALESHNTPVLWHPDETVRSSRIQAAVVRERDEYSDTSPRLAEIYAKRNVYLQAMDELTMATLTAKIMIVGEYHPERSTEQKKMLMAKLLVRQFDNGWLQSVDELVPGEPLDLSKDADLTIYQQEADDMTSEQNDPFVNRITGLLFDPENITDYEIFESNLHELNYLALDIIRATLKPGPHPTQAAHIDEQERRGTITHEQAEALLELLNNPNDIADGRA
jgi:hypothetical protein